MLFTFFNEKGHEEAVHNMEMELDQSQVYALLNAKDITYPKNSGNGSKSSAIVRLHGSHFDLFDNGVLVVEVRERSKGIGFLE